MNIKELNKDYVNTMKELSKKYFGNEGVWYKISEYNYAYEEFKAYDVFEELTDTQKGKAVEYCVEVYMYSDSNEISIALIVENFAQLLQSNSFNEIIETTCLDFIDSILW